MSFFANLINKTLPSSLEDVNLEQRVLNWLWFMLSCLQTVIYVTFFLTYSTVFYSDLVPPITIGFSILILGIGLIWFVANGPNNLSLNFGCTSILLAVVIPAFHRGGIQFPALIWMIPCLLFSALLQNRWAFFSWLSIYFASYTALYLYGPAPSADFREHVLIESYLHQASATFVIGLQIYFVSYAYASIVREKGRLQGDLEILLKENRNLLRILSHDISNPLTVLDISLQRIHISDPAMLKSLGRATKATKMLRELLEEVKSWQSLSDGKQELTMDISNLDEIIQKSIEFFTEKLLEKQILVQYKPCQCSAYVDSFVLTNQVMNNLISNAIKFSNEGSEIKIWVDDRQDSVEIHVADCGIGIPEELARRIFSVDSKTSRRGTFGEAGTGFGMPILKSSVEKMGGTVSLQSRSVEEFPQEHGTTFTVKLLKHIPVTEPKAA